LESANETVHGVEEIGIEGQGFAKAGGGGRRVSAGNEVERFMIFLLGQFAS
jgi:hypothetical protein